MFLTEMIKPFFSKPEKEKEVSSTIPKDNVLVDLSHDEFQSTGSFFDTSNSNSLFGYTEDNEYIHKQKNKIENYRKLAMTTDVNNAIDEIVNEIIFSYDDKMPLKINVNEENDKLVEAITNSFNKVTKLLNVKSNLFQLVKQGYIDGQLIIHCAYGKNVKDGIKTLKMIDPVLFHYDKKEEAYKYLNKHSNNTVQKKTELYSPEEIAREDFGLYENSVILSYLEYALKPANTLQVLEDLLVPLRFSRSISRRVFNVDIGDLPTKRGAEVMRDYQSKFKYKKFYNNETGEVANQQHITSMVEDYWFANRSGGKGTQVETLDESGNLGELDDILYYARKLYRSLKVPTSRLAIDPDSDHTFDYDTTQVSREDMKFFMFISRLRQVYSSLFKELLKREVVSTKTMTEKEWNEKEEQIEIIFTEENKFIEKMKLDALMSKFDLIGNSSEYAGKYISYTKLLKEVLKWNDEDIQENLKEIQKEKNDPLMKAFYEDDNGF